MNIGIITVYCTENCGSIMQATALSSKLKEMGHEVAFISTRNKYSGHSLKRLVKDCAKALIKRGSISAPIQKYRNYDIYIKNHFKTISEKQINNLDCIVLGSDTVWDITAQYFLASQSSFWGFKYKGIPIITYAASIANSPYEKLDELIYPVDAINSYESVSVRDEYTKKYVDEHTDKNALMVCDPTLLYTKERYGGQCFDLKGEKYLLLYLFDELNQSIAEEIKVFAHSNNLKIVSLNCMEKRISIADIWIESTIDNFLSYFNGADYIITNTFHGTVFSVIFNKQFIVLDYNKVKISDFLNQCQLSQRIVTDGIEGTLLDIIDYSRVNEELKALRESSETFLKATLQRCFEQNAFK